MRLILARHGETSWNREGRNQGRTPTELNARGVQQAKNLARALRKFPIRALYSSPLRRAGQTAETIAQTVSLPVILLDGLMEMDLGRVDGLTNAEMRERFPEIVEGWRNDPSSVRMPGGETLGDVQKRGWQAIDGIRRENPGAHAVAVTHNFVIVVLVLKVLRLPLSHFQRLRIELGSLTTLEHRRDRWRLLSLNETMHQLGA